jgi:hypothetical protein
VNAARCCWCEIRSATERDHLTGRDDAGRYLDPLLVVPSCRACNVCGFRCWKVSGLDVIGDARPALVQVRRLGVGFARLGDAGRPTIELPASTCTQVGVTLCAVADQFDEEHDQ